jgi:GrpB-like predicted nucleotidyltransferase (UPF0157 family)
VDEGELEVLVGRWRDQVVAALPEAEIHLVGSACVPGLAAEDVDLVALVDDVETAAARLRILYPPLYEEQWSQEWAAFRVAGPPQVDLVLTKRGSKWDAHHRLAWDLLRRDDALAAEYAALKEVPDAYAERKAEFFKRVVRLLSPDAATSAASGGCPPRRGGSA